MQRQKEKLKVELPSLSAERFIRELHVNDFAAPLGLCGFRDLPLPMVSFGVAVREFAIGFCDGTRLPFRPMDGGTVGLMCERNGERFWFHLSRKTFEENFTAKDE